LFEFVLLSMVFRYLVYMSFLNKDGLGGKGHVCVTYLEIVFNVLRYWLAKK
jgi:hypothetical protein